MVKPLGGNFGGFLAFALFDRTMSCDYFQYAIALMLHVIKHSNLCRMIFFSIFVAQFACIYFIFIMTATNGYTQTILSFPTVSFLGAFFVVLCKIDMDLPKKRKIEKTSHIDFSNQVMYN